MTSEKYIKEIDDLFDRWKKAQIEEPDQEYNKYRFGNVDKASFLPDGIINPDAYFSADKKVLFIAKEANWGGNDTEVDVNSQKDEFWLRDVVEQKYNPTMFSKGIAMLYNAYINNSFETPNYSHEGLKNIAFINLNKRGGYSYCSYHTLEGYAKKYGEYIVKQIDLINPDIIICCGTYLVEILNKYAKPKNCNSRIVGVYHPSYYGVSKEQHLKTFECILNNKPIEKTIETRELTNTKIKRGIIFDTNQSYNDAAIEDMLGTAHPCVSAFGKASEYIDKLNQGDVVFYYHKGTGIIAVGEVDGPVIHNKIMQEKRRSVKLIVSPVRTERGFTGVKVDNAFRNKVKNENDNKEFWLNKTAKVPYLYEYKDTETSEIKNAIELVEQKLKNG